MSKTKTVNGKDYRWDYKNKKWVQSHGASGGESLKRTASSVVGHVKSLFTKKDKKKNNLKTSSKTSVSDHKDTGHTKLVKGPDGKVRRVKVSDTTKDKTLKGSDTSKMKSGGKKKKMHSIEKRNREIHGDAKIDALKAKHAAWKEARKRKKKTTQGKSMPSNPKGMRQTGVGKSANDLTRHTTGSSKKKR